MNSVKNIVASVYYSGIVVSSALVIGDNARKTKDYDNADFAISCFAGGLNGAFVGLWWPLTFIGKCALAIDTVSKNN